MEKKTIYYILGGVAVIGIGYYLWSKNKKEEQPKEEQPKEEVTDESKTEEASNKIDTSKVKEKLVNPKLKSGIAEAFKNSNSTSNSSSVKKLTADELESRLQACGKKPSKLALKRNKEAYAKCRADLTAKLKSQGLVAFDGSYGFEGVSEIYQQNTIREKSFAEQVINREDGRMFAGKVYDNEFSGFDSNLDLNL
jgi:FtsZ-interacting cell division protein ZipA